MASTTRNRFGELGSSAGLNGTDRSRVYGASALGQGFSSSKWNGGGIWGPTPTVRSGLKGSSGDLSSLPDETMRERLDIKGPGSLLQSSESDEWNQAQNSHWAAANGSISPSFAIARSGLGNTSPARQRTAQTTRSSSPYFHPSQAAIGQGAASKYSGSSSLDPRSSSFQSAHLYHGLPEHAYFQPNGEVDTRHLDSIVFGSSRNEFSSRPGSNAGLDLSGYASSAASRSGSLPPSRHGLNQAHLNDGTLPDLHALQFGSVEIPSHRPNQSSRASNASNTPSRNLDSAASRTFDQAKPRIFDHATTSHDLVGDLSKLDLSRGSNGMWPTMLPDLHAPSHGPSAPYANGTNGHRTLSQSSEADARLSNLAAYHNQHRRHLHDHSLHSPGGSETRRHESPSYSITGTPPIPEHERAYSNASAGIRTPGAVSQSQLKDRLTQIQLHQQEQQFLQASAPSRLAQYPTAFEFAPMPSTLARMNPLAHYYQPLPMMPAYPQHLSLNRAIPRGPALDLNQGESLRSALLDEFRSSSKSNKRYELKDIYEHVVEFSGDQHGSRFIQQKLETANSDEKERLFAEILPNANQLMQDVFGNYVIQKFFEHGNQTQKKILAHQMKGQLLTLSLQMYGCRVVQKAFDHILVDQQAELIRELDSKDQVLKCVEDQNGNHVVQKAIERVPAEHIQFIIDAFTGQLSRLSTHPYGCRVVQRMLEHCKEPSRSKLLAELHESAQSLIPDQYGNYVTQHIIEHGRPEDRVKVISFITQNLVFYSRHKFASNVVEKSILFGSTEQRRGIVAALCACDEKGEALMQKLITDQYGNYVIRESISEAAAQANRSEKLIKQLSGAEYDEFVEQLKPQLQQVKRFQFGKQVSSIEQLVYGTSPSSLSERHFSPPPPKLPLAAPKFMAPSIPPSSRVMNTGIRMHSTNAPTPLPLGTTSSPDQPAPRHAPKGPSVSPRNAGLSAHPMAPSNRTTMTNSTVEEPSRKDI